MPTYEYECQKCGHTFEEVQSIKAEPLKTCPKKGCRGKVRRLLSAGGGLLFKGSGFYITDYRSEGYKKAKATESGAAGSADAGSKAAVGDAGGKAASAAAPATSST